MIKKENLNEFTEKLLNYLRNEINDNMMWKSFFSKMKVIQKKDNFILIFIPLEKEENLLQFKGIYKEIFENSIKIVFGEKINYELTIKNTIKEKQIEEKVINQISLFNNYSGHQKSNFFSLNNYNSQMNYENFLVTNFNDEVFNLVNKLDQNFLNLKTIYIYGQSGLGKTHLLHSIGNSFLKNKKNGFYITPLSFSIYIANLLQENNSKKITEVSELLSNLDILLIDDFQIFGEGQKTQTKNFINHILDNRILLNKLTIISSELDINGMEKLFDKRFVTRIQEGYIVKIQNPSLDDLHKLMEYKLNQSGFDIKVLDEKSKNLIVRNHSKSVRAIFGAAIKLINKKDEFKVYDDFVFDKVQNLFIDYIKEEKEVTFDVILKSVAKHYKVKEKEILGKSRKKEIVIARHICILLVHNLLTYSSTQIGRLFNRDHSTILSAIKKINSDDKNPSFKNALEFLIGEINGIN
ncbi:DnaA/Hda family protein [Mycoplasmopsis felis]|uniref:helix-turn-helix domain-containing protein n=1 Tax=Mycoplasmopsis felis TaxID=33923 RepID=UPI002AFEDDAD|nr:DnaA/Hda family protein [Mycoplasmopsis felis]WQQ09316.1 DnaA/Hda family protein [Mycoplasmopsis felis]